MNNLNKKKKKKEKQKVTKKCKKEIKRKKLRKFTWKLSNPQSLFHFIVFFLEERNKNLTIIRKLNMVFSISNFVKDGFQVKDTS